MLIHHINMRILFTIFINIMVFGNLISQSSFYIVPSINSKVGISSTNGFDHFSKNYPSNDFFQVINKSFHYFPSINFGLGLGWKNENQKFSVDLTWNQDVASVSNETVYLASNGDYNYYFNANIPYRIGFVTNRFSLNFSKPLFKDLFEINLGIGILNLPGGKDNYEFVVDFDPGLYDSTTTLKRKYSTRAVSPYSMNLSIGFNMNLNWNGWYLFTLSALYSQGISRNLIIHENYYEIQNTSTNETIKYSYSSASKGSGVFIQVSRRFTIYAWSSRRKAHNNK